MDSKEEKVNLSLKYGNSYIIEKHDLIVDCEPMLLLPDLILLLLDVKSPSPKFVLLEALIIQRLHFETERAGIVLKDAKFVQINLKEWWAKHFWFIHPKRFETVVTKLIDQNFILNYKIDDNNQWLRVNYKRLEYKDIYEIRKKMAIKIKKLKQRIQKLKKSKTYYSKRKLMELKEKVKKKATKAVFFKL
ncbi:MAG: hypothetical protein RMJ67_07760 [Elusimicrobiota bacterium]|nr:hypothetical protein [Endomicrobiia bacterium]MDW8166388.1 hypothetical protein [Elusimicrobiota bacterium]